MFFTVDFLVNSSEDERYSSLTEHKQKDAVVNNLTSVPRALAGSQKHHNKDENCDA